jgi:hypothetical protein
VKYFCRGSTLSSGGMPFLFWVILIFSCKHYVSGRMFTLQTFEKKIYEKCKKMVLKIVADFAWCLEVETKLILTIACERNTRKLRVWR